MRTTLIALTLLLPLTGCVTTESTSGWSFNYGGSSNKSYNYNVVSKAEGHPVRSGNESLRFEVRSGDCGTYKSGYDDCKYARERREQSQADYNRGEYWYHWSIYLPKDFPGINDGGSRVVMGQFHTDSPGTKGGHQLQQFANELIDDKSTGEQREVYALIPWEVPLAFLDDMRGDWTDILLHVNWTERKDGFFRVYVNGNVEPTYSRSGRTRRSDVNVYFKFGIYRARGKKTQVVYYDDVRRGRTCEEVTTHFKCEALEQTS